MPSVRELSEQNQFSDIIRLLNVEIEAVSGSPAAAQLLCNRGLCHQRLNLNRKALKVRGASGCLLGTGQPWKWCLTLIVPPIGL